MSDPERLNRGGSGEPERLLLDSVRDDRPAAGAQARTMAALGVGTAIGVSSVAGGAAAVAAPKVLWGTTALLVAKWVVIGAGTGIAAVAIAHNVAPHPMSSGPSLHATAAIANVPRSAPSSMAPTNRMMRSATSIEMPPASTPSEVAKGGAPSLAPTMMAPEPPSSALVLRVDPPMTARAQAHPARQDITAAPPAIAVSSDTPISAPGVPLPSAPTRVASPAPAPPSALARQTAALDEARRMLQLGDTTRTLALLDGYATAFPAGELMPEATLLRIEALLKMGQRSAAERVAGGFLAHNPSSTHANRIRRLLDGSASH